MFNLCFHVITFVVLTLSGSGLVHAQACSSPDISDVDWRWGITAPPIEAFHSGNIIQYRMENTNNVTAVNNGFNRKYIDAGLEGNILTIFTTDAFADYEEYESALKIDVQIDLVCTTGVSTFMFEQSIIVRNNHVPMFSKGTYDIKVQLPLPKGFDLTYYEEVSARDIDLSNNRVTFDSPNSSLITVGTSETTSNDKKTFFATLVLNQQLLTLHEPLSITIIATDSDVENPGNGVAQIHIIADDEITYVPIPRFEKAIYRGNIDDSGILSTEDPTIDTDSYSEHITFELIGDDSELFSIEIVTNFSVKVALKAPIDLENLNGKTFLTATLNANHPEVASGSTILLIDLPRIPATTTQKPSFEKSLIRGSINSESVLVVESVVLTESSYAPEITFSLSGDDSSAFNLTSNLNIVSISLVEAISEVELDSRDFYSFIVVATHPTSGTAETAVLISVPMKTCEECPECPDCPECPVTTECPECPTPGPPVVDMTPTFQNQFYSFSIKSNEVGRIGDVLATSFNPDVDIEYSIVTSNGYLQARLLIDSNSGELFIREELSSGYYEADAIAKLTIDDEELEGKTLVKITVVAVTVCPSGDVTVSKSLAIEYLRENEIHPNIFSTKIEDCSYSIDSVVPSDKDYVFINESTNMLESISFDREDIIFDDYEVPQIQIKLKLICDENPTTFNQINSNKETSPRNFTQSQVSRPIDPSFGDGRWYALTNDIDFKTDLTVINLIIEDVNDNDPIFDQLTPTLIGYPEPDLANNIIPSHLTIIHATDRDAGINAKIKYTLNENNYFKIHPDSGVISPLSAGFSSTLDSVQLTIYATDNYGAAVGRSASHVLRVKRLEDRHLTVVTISDYDITSSDDVIDQLNSESSIKMMILHSAIVPYKPTNTRQGSGPLTVLKMIVYAFGSDGEPLVTSRVQSELEHFMTSRQLTYSSYEDSLPSESAFIGDNTTWIIVVSVLGVFTLIAILVIFLMWWYKIRPYEYKTMIEETAVSQENLRNDFQNYEVESSPPMSRFDVAKEKRESVNISGSTDMESTDDPTNTARSLLNLLEDDDLKESNIPDENEKRERRKSQGVTFNELVERIDIETDPTADSDTDVRI